MKKITLFFIFLLGFFSQSFGQMSYNGDKSLGYEDLHSSFDNYNEALIQSLVNLDSIAYDVGRLNDTMEVYTGKINYSLNYYEFVDYVDLQIGVLLKKIDTEDQTYQQCIEVSSDLLSRFRRQFGYYYYNESDASYQNESKTLGKKISRYLVFSKYQGEESNKLRKKIMDIQFLSHFIKMNFPDDKSMDFDIDEFMRSLRFYDM